MTNGWAAFVRLVLAVTSTLLSGQTRLSPDQVRATITVVEWAKCEAAGPGWDCHGIELFRFRLSDGRTLGPYVASPAAPTLVIKPSDWTSVPLVP